MSTNTETTTDDRSPVLTGYTYKDPDTCGLYTSGHRIAAAFDDVLSAFEDSFTDLTADVVAGGCNTCTRPDEDADVWAYYVAQGRDDTDTLYVGYGAADEAELSASDVANRLCDVADEQGVAVDWSGSTTKKVCLGDGEAYDGENALYE